MLLARRLQPSFAVVDDRLLVLASTPALLGRAAAHMRSSVASAPTPAYFSGAVRIDSFATNAARYLRAFLLRGDRYSPDEIQARIEPLRRAISIYSSLDWEFTEQNGVRSGWARIH
jgi:hypothetical protein